MTGQDISQQIRVLLDSRNIEYEYYEHKEVQTSEQAAAIRGESLEIGAKSLILQGKKTSQRIMVIVPAHLRVDMKKVAEYHQQSHKQSPDKFDNTAKFQFANPDDIYNDYGIKVGGVPPFGNLLKLAVYMDLRLLKNEKVAFNCGLRTASIIMPSDYLPELSQAHLGDFVQLPIP